MAKILQGKIVSIKMANTVVVQVTRLVPHPIYKKIMRKSKKYKVDTNGVKAELGQVVKIVETRPMSKEKYFKILSQEEKKPLKIEEKKPLNTEEKKIKKTEEKKVVKERKKKA